MAEEEYNQGVIKLSKLYFYNGQLHLVMTIKNKKTYNVLEAYNVKGKKLDFGTLKNGKGTLNMYNLNTGKLERTIKI